jgi:HK97 family phage major capsid protein
MSYTSEIELREQIRRLDANAAGRKMTDDERQTWNDLNGKLEEMRKRRGRLQEFASRSRNLEHTFEATATPRRIESRDEGLRAIEANLDAHVGDSADRLDEMLRSHDPVGLGGRYLRAVANPHYLSAFGKMVADPSTGHLRFTPEEGEAVRLVTAVEAERAMNEGTGSSGGYAVPYVLDPSIIASGSGATNPIRQIARVVTIVGSNEWKGVSSDGVVAAYSAEATEASDGTPTLAQPDIKAAKWNVFVPFSIEVDQDWSSLQTELVTMAEDAKSVLEATKFLTGTGSNEPGGILNIGGTGGLTTTQRVQTAVSATYAVGDPWLLKAQIPPRFIARATFAAAPAVWDKTYRFVGTNSVEPLQMPSRDGAFLGRSKVEWSTMATATTTGTKLIVGGDFSKYVIVDRLGMQVELIPHLFGASNRFPTGQRGLYMFGRTGAGVVAANAFRYLEVL